jgi:hypothetical protein
MMLAIAAVVLGTGLIAAVGIDDRIAQHDSHAGQAVGSRTKLQNGYKPPELRRCRP